VGSADGAGAGLLEPSSAARVGSADGAGAGLLEPSAAARVGSADGAGAGLLQRGRGVPGWCAERFRSGWCSLGRIAGCI